MDGYEPVGIQHASGKGSNLCAYRRPLVEGVSGAGGTVRLYNGLDCALAGHIYNAVGIRAEHKRLVYAIGRTVIYDLGVGGLYDHYAEQLAQFAVIYLFGVAVFGNVLPEGIALKVVHGVAVNYAAIVGFAALADELARLSLREGAN